MNYPLPEVEVMAATTRIRTIGILTGGGDCQALNAAIRSVAKSAIQRYGIEVIGFLDGFRGLVENRTVRLDESKLSNLLTAGGTILGTSRDKPHKMVVPGKGTMDMTAVAVANYRSHRLDCLVCLGGGGTQKNALRLQKAGLNVVTLPKTIDNDVWGTEVSFGFDTAMTIATEAIDRIHTTAESHNRVMIVETMGHNTGWLALGAGLAGGAEAILLPEIPYRLEALVETILERSRKGRHFSILVIAEGARPAADSTPKDKGGKKSTRNGKAKNCSPALEGAAARQLAQAVQDAIDMEVRVTSLGHVQRGGAPSPLDRLLATQLGATCMELVAKGKSGFMVAVRGEKYVPVPLEEVAGERRTVPRDHPWLKTARQLGICLGE